MTRPTTPQTQELPDLPEDHLRAAVELTTGRKAEYSGQFCDNCDDTTAHFRPRKTSRWFCVPCYLPGGFAYKIVTELNNRLRYTP